MKHFGLQGEYHVGQRGGYLMIELGTECWMIQHWVKGECVRSRRASDYDGAIDVVLAWEVGL